MAGISLMFYALVVVVAVAFVWLIVHRREPLRVDGAVGAAFRAARRRALVAIGFAAVLLLAGVVLAFAQPGWLGIPAAVAPALAGAGGLFLYAATPPPQAASESTGRFTASLERRGPVTVAPRRAAVAFGIAVLLTVLLLVATGLSAGLDDAGRSRAITFVADDPLTVSTASPYPGWFYSVPLLISTVLLVAATWFALRRIAVTASLPGEGLEDLDRKWRSSSGRVVIGVATAAALLQLGGIAVFAGNSMGNAAGITGVEAIWQILATMLFIGGEIVLVVSIGTAAVTAMRAFTLPAQTLRGRSTAEVRA